MSHLQNSQARRRALEVSRINAAQRLDPGYDAWRDRVIVKAVATFIESCRPEPRDDRS